MYCQKCGKELADNAAFCQYCGERFQPTSSAMSQEGTITFYREKSAAAALVSAKISIDGTQCCGLKVNERHSVTLPYGMHTVVIKIATNPATTYTVFIGPTNPNLCFSFKVQMNGKTVVSGEEKAIVPMAKKKAKNPAAIVLAIIALLVFFTFKTLNWSSSKNSIEAKDNVVSTAETTPNPTFQPVSGTVGNWEITVNDFSYTNSISAGVLHEYRSEENSKYCVVNITVKNIGQEMATFFPIVYYGNTTIAKIKWNDLEYTRSGLMFSKDNLSSEDLNPLVSTSGDVVFELPNEIIDSDTSPILVFSYGSDSLSFELVKK